MAFGIASTPVASEVASILLCHFILHQVGMTFDVASTSVTSEVASSLFWRFYLSSKGYAI